MKKLLILALLFASACGILIVGFVERIAPSFVTAAVCGVVLTAVYVMRKRASVSIGSNRLATLMAAGCIFLAGAVYGLVQDLREGLSRMDVIRLIPFGIAGCFFAAALKSTTTPETTGKESS
jgi:hypothetical protein